MSDPWGVSVSLQLVFVETGDVCVDPGRRRAGQDSRVRQGSMDDSLTEGPFLKEHQSQVSVEG